MRRALLAPVAADPGPFCSHTSAASCSLDMRSEAVSADVMAHAEMKRRTSIFASFFNTRAVSLVSTSLAFFGSAARYSSGTGIATRTRWLRSRTLSSARRTTATLSRTPASSDCGGGAGTTGTMTHHLLPASPFCALRYSTPKSPGWNRAWSAVRRESRSRRSAKSLECTLTGIITSISDPSDAVFLPGSILTIRSRGFSSQSSSLPHLAARAGERGPS
mmetsp:Transcript_38663/g.91438  ORF Transcript_38663/g.91438 Transcript_38663/m.91438 type:complete len:219 (+) Transcript_38663:238-894(+)